jgi:hypothetical protein
MTVRLYLTREPLLTSDPISRHVEFRHGLLASVLRSRLPAR